MLITKSVRSARLRGALVHGLCTPLVDNADKSRQVGMVKVSHVLRLTPRWFVNAERGADGDRA